MAGDGIIQAHGHSDVVINVEDLAGYLNENVLQVLIGQLTEQVQSTPPGHTTIENRRF